jgi:stalled ribosome alternative rescue factor ArfA
MKQEKALTPGSYLRKRSRRERDDFDDSDKEEESK